MKTMKTLTEKRFFEWHEDDVAVTLRNKGGSYGGGSEVLIINSSGNGVAGTLDSSYFKGQGERQGIEREYIVTRNHGE